MMDGAADVGERALIPSSPHVTSSATSTTATTSSRSSLFMSPVLLLTTSTTRSSGSSLLMSPCHPTLVLPRHQHQKYCVGRRIEELVKAEWS